MKFVCCTEQGCYFSKEEWWVDMQSKIYLITVICMSDFHQQLKNS